MSRTAQKLRDDALRIWRAGVAAVDSALLVREAVRVEDSLLRIGDEVIVPFPKIFAASSD